MSYQPQRPVYTVNNNGNRMASGPIRDYYEYRQGPNPNYHSTATVTPEPHPNHNVQNGHRHQHRSESEGTKSSETSVSDPFGFSVAQKCVAELVGVMIFVFIGSLASRNYSLLLAAVAHGVTMAINIIVFGHISGGHFNPAVTLGVAICGKIHPLLACSYVASQLVGSFIGGLLVRAVVPATVYCTMHGGATLPAPFTDGGYDYGMVLGLEVVLTYILVQVVLNAALESDGKSLLAPLAIGFTIMTDICAGGDISGASMNPARSFGPLAAFSVFRNTSSISAVADCKSVEDVWMYSYIHWAGPACGAVIAALVYKFLFARRENRWFKYN